MILALRLRGTDSILMNIAGRSAILPRIALGSRPSPE